MSHEISGTVNASEPFEPSRRNFLKFGSAIGALAALGSLPVFETAAMAVIRPGSLTLTPNPITLWYGTPGSEAKIMDQGLPFGNGRLGGLVTGGTATDVVYLTDCSMWTGNANQVLQGDGQFSFDTTNFGTFGQLARAYVNVTGHASVTNYQRQLDLSNGYAKTTYTIGAVTYTREVYASYPDDVVIMRLTQTGGGSYSGSVQLSGTRSETTTADAAAKTASFSATLSNGLKYAAVAKVFGTGGTVGTSGANVTFTSCSEVIIVFSGGTNYVPDSTRAYKDASVTPLAVANTKANAVAGVSGDSLLATHVADYQPLFGSLAVNLGPSTAAQRAKDTPTRLADRAASGASADPELEASYLHFGRYLMITGSRGSLPLNLQGLWIDTNSPGWMSDYHTDINVQMNYWLADRGGLGSSFNAFADYCVAQLPGWITATQNLFQDSRNRFRNSSGAVAGWTLAISTNIWGGNGWYWHPAGNAWMCQSLFDHYEYTQDASYLDKIYPLLKGACQFWQSRLITDPATGKLIDDADWSPEHGPEDAKGITYSQELVYNLFKNYQTAAAVLNRDAAYASTVAGLQANLYLPQVNASTGWLEEWKDAGNLGETTHRHLSHLVGLFPGDRIAADTSPAALLTGVTNVLTARGMDSYGWAMAWRGLCWARLKDANKAYQSVITNLKPSDGVRNGSAINLFDMYGGTIFQIDANFGTPAAMLEMLLYTRVGTIELLPALPAAWQTSGSAHGLRAKGAFTLDLTWSTASNQTTVTGTIWGTPGSMVTVKFGTWSSAVTIPSGGTLSLNPPARQVGSPSGPGTVKLVNRRSGQAIDVPGSSTANATALIQWPLHGNPNQQWAFTAVGTGIYKILNVNSGLAADVNGGGTADGATIIQWPYGGSTNQQWTIVDAGGGYSKLVNVRSGKVIGVQDNSTSSSAAIVQQTDTGDISQHWQLVP